ncbi:MAG: type I-B CRISPR-associated protein Cas8b1/Cst1 [Thermoguttaceae bacterium]|nr:type I-B CRISPR-associated protein Cas8b1/Cst1 [Thermoguttaceae bacterium]
MNNKEQYFPNWDGGSSSQKSPSEGSLPEKSREATDAREVAKPFGSAESLSTRTLKLTTGDFLKNAGIVGFLKLWSFIKRKRTEKFEIGDEIPVSELPDGKELAQYVMNLYIREYREDSKVQKAFDKLKLFAERIDANKSLDGSDGDPLSVDFDKIKGDVEDIYGALSAASIKSGYEGIKDQVSHGEVYENFLKHKLKLPKPKDDQTAAAVELRKRLSELAKFCAQRDVRQTFLFKSIAYTVINRFWSDKCFLLRTNAKKNMARLIEDDFTTPFYQYLTREQKPVKAGKTPKIAVNCISCSNPMATTSEATPISFMIDIADDLNRKTSTFWNHNPDAYLCPVCALIYSLAPLGFWRNNTGDFVFVNSNSSISRLWNNNNNSKKTLRNFRVSSGRDLDISEQGSETNSLLSHVDFALLEIIDEMKKCLSKVQVVVQRERPLSKPKDKKYDYCFNIIGQDVQFLIHKVELPEISRRYGTVRINLGQLARRSLKLASGDYFNVFRHCLDNVLGYQNQYNLLNMLILESLKKPKNDPNHFQKVGFFLAPVFRIQTLQFYHRFKDQKDQKDQKEQEDSFMADVAKLQYFATLAGDKMRYQLLADAVGQDNVKNLKEDRKEDIVRGVVYQLTNALKTRDVERFLDVLIRLYASSKEPIPTVFTKTLQDEEAFTLIGYAYVLGLKGAFYKKDADDAQQGATNSQN